VMVFAPTPFQPGSLELDLDGFRANLEFLAGSGVNAVAVAGFVGEFSALTPEEYQSVIEAAADVLHGRALVVAGVGYGSHLAARYAAVAEAAGADCVMLLPPYLVAPTESGMVEHTRLVARATTLGVMVHSMPGFAFTPRLVERLAEIPGVIAYKDELGDVRSFQAIVDRVGDRIVYVNGRAEPVIGFYFAVGASVNATAIGNFDPAVALAAYQAARNLDFPGLREVMAPRAAPWYELRERNRGYLISVNKASMNLVGLHGGTVRPPLSDLDPVVLRELADLLSAVGYRLVEQPR
jgi:5-dehydro-4-deoxyglucarate dehydratase